MKKILALIVVCFVLCGCSGKTNEQVKVIPTNTPTKVPTIAPTENPAQEKVTTDDLIAAYSKEPTCVLCGKDAEFVTKYNEIIYNTCHDCYLIVKKNQADLDTYDLLYNFACISILDEGVIEDVSKLGPCYIYVGPNGVEFENASDNLMKQAEIWIPDYKTITSTQECALKIFSENGITYVKKEKVPVHIFDTLK